MAKKEAADKKNDEAEAKAAVKSLDEMILNYGTGKYSAIPLTAYWAKELRRREENRHLTPTELLETALSDVLSGKVDWKDVKKVIAAGEAPQPNGDEKASKK
jgi:hypothetical protein